MRNLLIVLLALIYIQCSVPSDSLSRISAEEAGFNPELIEGIDTAMQKYIDQKRLGGISTMLVKDGHIVQFKNYGYADVENHVLLNNESIFRIYSMTKSITSVALMKLYEEGKFQLDDPVSNYIPEFKGMKVFAGIENGVVQLEDQINEMTIRHLITHSAGFTYGWSPNSYVDSLYQADSLLLWDELLEDKVKRIAKIPLKHQPGTKWEYSVSIDVLGYLIEVLSGQKLDSYLSETIFIPLKMSDTGFSVPEDQVRRYTAVYTPDSLNQIKVLEPIQESRFIKPAVFLMGGGGLQSTMMDYARFCQMILNNGQLDGIRILTEETMSMIKSDQMPDGLEAWPGAGWAIGFKYEKNAKENGQYPYQSELAWSGAADTHFWIDVENQLFGLVFTQQMPNNRIPFNKDFKRLVYQALEKSN